MLSHLLLLFALVNSASTIKKRAVSLEVSDEQKKSIRTELNKYRAAKGGGNMYCLSEWSPELEEVAAKLALECSAEPFVTDKRAGTIFVVTETTDIAKFIAELGNMENKYDHGNNACNPANDSACDNYKRFVWWEGGKFACRFSICKAPPNHVSSMLTCVFEKEPGADQPFAKGTACHFCGRDAQCVDDLCCPGDKEDPPQTDQARCGRRPTDLIPLYRMVHQVHKDTVLTSQDRIDQLKNKNYEDQGILGYSNLIIDSYTAAKIVKVFPSNDGYVRSALLETEDGRHLLWDINRISIVEGAALKRKMPVLRPA
uniref:SCP domain-containing protein n=1 Tax=Trichuris muris TaxID=70415 RepID=A0A5S6QWJ2_TRIMR